MPTIARKRSDITDKSALIDWLAKKFKRSYPQKEVLISFVKYFNQLTNEFKNHDMLGYADGGWEEVYYLCCSIADEYGETRLCNDDVMVVIADTFGRAMGNHGRVSAADFVALQVQLVELDGLQLNRTDKAVKITSTGRFFANWGFNINVVLPRC
ncbi:hypothetical protein ACWGTO_30565 [Mesorhizobium sp. PL10]